MVRRSNFAPLEEGEIEKTSFIATIETQAHSSFAPFSRLVAAIGAWGQRRAKRGRVVRELNAYSDRDLADLGFTRGDIRSVANGTYKR